MLRLDFTEGDKRVLARERFHHHHPRVRRRMEVLWLKSQGLAHQEVARLAGVSAKTMRSYFRQYVEGGTERLKELRFRRPQSQLLNHHQEAITAHFHDHLPASINEAAHFVLGTFMSILWCYARVWIRAPSGRQRFNVLGALNAVTREIVTVVNATYINARSVCEPLDKLAAGSPTLPITVILDNARYQRCKLVKTHATKLGIELLFLPTYSPNLTLIERLWKFVKKQCLYAKHYRDFASFTNAIEGCLRDAQTIHAKALRSLLTLNFQTFSKSSVVTA